MHYLIHTARLRLREMEESDAPLMFELNRDPEVLRYTGDASFSNLAEALEIVRYVRAQYATQGMGRWAVELVSTGEVIGWCGLKKWPDSGMVDLGYRLFRRFWGAGYATEAAMACVRYGFDTLGLPEITGRVVPANVASVRVLEKLGFARTGEAWEHGEHIWIFSRGN